VVWAHVEADIYGCLLHSWPLSQLIYSNMPFLILCLLISHWYTHFYWATHFIHLVHWKLVRFDSELTWSIVLAIIC
jgi:hypothetical protein